MEQSRVRRGKGRRQSRGHTNREGLQNGFAIFVGGLNGNGRNASRPGCLRKRKLAVGNGGGNDSRIGIAKNRKGKGYTLLQEDGVFDKREVFLLGVGWEGGPGIARQGDFIKGRIGRGLVDHGKRRVVLNHIHTRTGDRGEYGEATVLVVEVGSVVAQIKEELAGGGVGITTLLGHGDGAIGIGDAGFVDHRRGGGNSCNGAVGSCGVGKGEATLAGQTFSRRKGQADVGCCCCRPRC